MYLNSVLFARYDGDKLLKICATLTRIFVTYFNVGFNVFMK